MSFTKEEKEALIKSFTDKMDAMEEAYMRHLGSIALMYPADFEEIRLEAVNAEFTD